MFSQLLIPLCLFVALGLFFLTLAWEAATSGRRTPGTAKQAALGLTPPRPGEIGGMVSSTSEDGKTTIIATGRSEQP